MTSSSSSSSSYSSSSSSSSSKSSTSSVGYSSSSSSSSNSSSSTSSSSSYLDTICPYGDFRYEINPTHIYYGAGTYTMAGNYNGKPYWVNSSGDRTWYVFYISGYWLVNTFFGSSNGFHRDGDTPVPPFNVKYNSNDINHFKGDCYVSMCGETSSSNLYSTSSSSSSSSSSKSNSSSSSSSSSNSSSSSSEVQNVDCISIMDNKYAIFDDWYVYDGPPVPNSQKVYHSASGTISWTGSAWFIYYSPYAYSMTGPTTMENPLGAYHTYSTGFEADCTATKC